MKYVRVAVWIALALALVDGYLAFRKLFTVETTAFSCERATNACAIDGSIAHVPALSDIRAVSLRREHVARLGAAYDITLELVDGRTRDINPERAIGDDSIADYRASVDAIRAFLVDRDAPRLTTTFTYRPSFGEKLNALAIWLGITAFAAVGLVWWRRSPRRVGKADHSAITQ